MKFDPELLLPRWLSKVSFDQIPGCWIWTGGVTGSNVRARYGTTNIKKSPTSTEWRSKYIHVLSYEIYVGEILPGLEIDHLCRNILCLNPEHLEAVTHKENRRRARLDVCRKGIHDLTKPGSVRWDDRGYRRGCMQCHRDKALARYYRNKEEGKS